MATAIPHSGRAIAQYQAKAILGAAISQAVMPEIELRLKGGEPEESIRKQLMRCYQDYVLFPDDWATTVLREAEVAE
jgi:hypothetical protein